MNLFNNNDIDKMVEILKNDGVLAVPTDTIYGLCARINSDKAFDHLVQVKQRPSNKSFSMMCSDIDQIKEYAILTGSAERIVKKFMPGPITIVLSKNDSFINNNSNGIDSIGIRMATSDVLKEVIKRLGRPIFMTSANISGMPSCKSIDEIKKVFPTIDGILDGNVLFGQASTIVDCTTDDVKILREGPISIEQIKDVL